MAIFKLMAKEGLELGLAAARNNPLNAFSRKFLMTLFTAYLINKYTHII